MLKGTFQAVPGFYEPDNGYFTPGFPHFVGQMTLSVNISFFAPGNFLPLL